MHIMNEEGICLSKQAINYYKKIVKLDVDIWWNSKIYEKIANETSESILKL